MKKSLSRSPSFLISAAGLFVLLLLYAAWNIENPQLGLAERISAFLSAALFALVCLRFVPRWMSFWRFEGEYPEEEPDGFEPPRVRLNIFLSLLLFCVSVLALVYVLRGLLGRGWNLAESLTFWQCTDSNHYLDIARDWYLSEGEWDRLVQLVFLPGYPLAIRLLQLFTGNYLYAGLLVSALSFAGAGCLFYSLLRLDYAHSDALRALKYLCLIPGSFFFAAPMSESLFLLLSLGCVYCARKGRWLSGGLLGGLAAFTRSLGLMLFVPLFFELIFNWRHSKGFRLANALALLLIPAGFGAYCLINYLVSGNAFQYLEYQRVHWSQELGLFFNTAAYQLDWALSTLRSASTNFLGLWGPNLLCSFGALVLLFFAGKELRPSYTAWALAYYVIAIGTTWLLSAPRYLAVLTPIHISLAVLGRKEKTDRVLTGLLLLFSTFYLFAFVMRWQVW